MFLNALNWSFPLVANTSIIPKSEEYSSVFLYMVNPKIHRHFKETTTLLRWRGF